MQVDDIRLKRQQLSKEKKYWEEKYRKIIGSIVKSEQRSNITYKKRICDLNVACIFDEFTMECFKPECNLITFTPENWKQVLSVQKPDILIVESAWEGNNGTWHRKVARHTTDERKEIFDLIEFCNDNQIPTVFWNKEDPVHFNAFIDTAILFDYIFTTDADSIKRYRKVINKDNVYPLPFAAQPKIHNPIEIYDKREGKVCFAGSYYATKYDERKRDFKILFDVSIKYGLDIYDRHYNDGLEQYRFPAEYQKYIRGKLKATEMQKAYKGYKISVNVNSVKDSSTMFSRRVFELVASNTPVISSYSVGIKNIFGDLVVSSDNYDDIEKELCKLFNDKIYYEKYRLLGLRKVLKYHTYKERLKYIMKTIGSDVIDDDLSVSVLTFVKSQEEIDAMIKQFQRQTYSKKELLVLLGLKEQIKNKDYENIKFINLAEIGDKKITDIVNGNYIACFNHEDFYSQNYLEDLVIATSYTDACIIGKSAYYFYDIEKAEMSSHGCEYKYVDDIGLFQSIISLNILQGWNVSKLIQLWDNNIKLNKNIIKCNRIFSIDKYNYFKGFTTLQTNDKEYAIRLVGDIGNLKLGRNEFNYQVEPCNIDLPEDFIDISLNNNKWMEKSQSIIEVSNFGQSLVLNIRHNDNDAFEYVQYEIIKPFDVEPATSAFKVDTEKQYNVEFYGVSNRLSIELFILCYSKSKKIQVERFNLNQEGIFIPSPEVDKLSLALRVAGQGSCSINRIRFIPITNNNMILDESKKKDSDGNEEERYLVLTNIYPSYSDLYRNAFVHSRVRAYIGKGLNVDVFTINRDNKVLSKYIFENVTVYKGNKDNLSIFLKQNNYKKILIHFVNKDMIDSINSSVKNVPLIIWIHGFESEKWQRRWFNIVINKRIVNTLISTIKASNARIKFMNELFSLIDRDLKFVFVSKYKKETAEQDAKCKLKQYFIVHNIVDEEIFRYQKKDSDKRKKILSIRPFTARNYANDLSVKAILELSKEKFFYELDFTIYGKGCLFNSILEPLREFSNVHIHEKFLTQYEIAELHKENGIFLCPTRLDSQGVSIGEAMSSGLVPVTNGVAAIPEFVDESCGILSPPNSYKGLADGIKELYLNPEKYLKLSYNASVRARSQCGKSVVIPKEIEIITK